MSDSSLSGPQPQISVFDAVVIMVGMVVGIGIFRTPSIVASNVSSEWMFIMVWAAGGLVTLIGALCYSELSAAHPHAGGEYHFLSRAYGRACAMMFGWARCTVIQTGAIAAVAFILGDYLSQLVPLGSYGPSIYAALAVTLLTLVNVVGTAEGKNLQIVVTLLQTAAIVGIILFGFFASGNNVEAAPTTSPANAALGMAMIFVLLTYGGWNEAAYLTGELNDAPRNIAKVLVIGTVILVSLYVAINMALLSVLGLEGIRQSDVVAADMMRAATGAPGEIIVTLVIVAAALSTLNATIFTGARVFYAMSNDMTILGWLSVWNKRGKTPANGLLTQGGIALALIALGTFTRDGFESMVNYTAPVFWFFLLLVGAAVFVLRKRFPERKLPYRVPLYPVTPALFCLTCLYMLYSSMMYTGAAGLIGVAVLVAGLPLLLFRKPENIDVTSHDPASSKVTTD